MFHLSYKWCWWQLFLLSVLVVFCISNKGYSQSTYPFEGNVDLTSRQIDFSLTVNEESSIVVTIKKFLKDSLHVTLNLEKLQMPVFNISSTIESSIEYGLAGKGNVSIIGKLWSNYTLVNYKPIQELSGRYEIGEQSITLSNVNFGTVLCNGTIEFQKPYKLDLIFDISEMELISFLKFWTPHKEYNAEGMVSGQIKASGSVNQLNLRGNLNTSDGYVGKLNFDRIHLNASGEYPTIQIAQSIISQTGGMSFDLSGSLDLSDTKNFKKQLKALDISPLTSESELQSEWTIKRFKDEDVTTEFKYFIRDGGSKTSEDPDEGIIGIERKVEF